MSDGRGQGYTGLLAIDKPDGPTSHDVVERVRGILGSKAGHAGTLDPQATGVLLVCLGGATRLARFLQGHDKVYEGTVRLGFATDTYDAEGEPIADPVVPPALVADDVETALESFVGTIEQVPPAYSAKKVRGQPSYRRARRGEDVRPKPVSVDVRSIDLMRLGEDTIDLRVHCGAGTYVRTLAHDLGAALGCPAHLAALRRTRSGPFTVDRAVPWSLIEEGEVEALAARIMPPAEMLPDWPAAVVGGEGADAVTNGRIVEAGWIVERRPGASAVGTGGIGDGWVRLIDGGGAMIAAGEMVPGGLVQPRIVLR